MFCEQLCKDKRQTESSINMVSLLVNIPFYWSELKFKLNILNKIMVAYTSN